MPNIVTPSEAAALLEFRSRARNSMAAYIDYLEFGYTLSKHHILMCEKLQAVAQKKIPKLALLMPPGSGKSEIGNKIFCSWYLGNNPSDTVLACSHTQALASRFGRKTRNLFSRPDNVALFGVDIAKDSQAASEWATDKDGEYFAAGVGVAIAGRRADIALIDDPHTGRESADSLHDQERVWDWYNGDFLPRLKPTATQILIQTRWHQRDLGGRIFEREADQWEIIELPMEARENDILGRAVGERLWPEWFSNDQKIATAKLDVRSWNSEYQQQPVSDEGDYFKLNYFSDFDSVPDNAHYYGASDYAVTEGHGDWTEHGVFALDTFGNIYIVDWWRGQAKPDIWIERQCDLIQQHEPLAWFGEAGPIRRATESYLNVRMTERNANCRIEWLSSINDKATRCRSFQALAARGKVFLPRYASWKAELLKQLTHFPAGSTDDGVDTCSLLGRGLDLVKAPRMKSRWAQSSSSLNYDVAEQGWMVS